MKAHTHTQMRKKQWPTRIRLVNPFNGDAQTLTFVITQNGKGTYKGEDGTLHSNMPYKMCRHLEVSA
jgi:hypothetical protein